MCVEYLMLAMMLKYIFRATHASEATMLFPILTEVHLHFFATLMALHLTPISQSVSHLAGQSFDTRVVSRLASLFMFIVHLYQVLGVLSDEEVTQSTRLIKLRFSFMLDGKLILDPDP